MREITELTAAVADLREIRALYRERLVRDFPRSEIKPFFAIRALVRRDVYGCLTVRDGDGTVAAYFFYLIDRVRGVLFVDYFAVDASRRGEGVGSEALRLLGEAFPGLDVLLEVEDPAKAGDEADEALRRRRIAFYERAGFRMTALRVLLFGVDFNVMVRSKKEPGDPAHRENLEAVYDAMFPTRFARKNAKVYI